MDRDFQLSLLKKLAEISSGSSDPAGVNQVQHILKDQLEKWGFRCELVANPRADIVSGKLLVATLEGFDPRFITFVTHSDTLGSASTHADLFSLDEKRGRVIGQGILDDKACQVVALAGIGRYLESLKARGSDSIRPAFSLRFVASPSEEAGSTGFHSLFREFGKDSVMALGFEPSLDDGAIVESRRGNRWYQIHVSGAEAHSGRAHDKGANAAHELAIKLVELQKLTNYKRGITVNIGHIQAGRGLYNVVCGLAEAKVDVRFSDYKSAESLRSKIEKILAKNHVRAKVGDARTQTSWEIVDDCPAFCAEKNSKAFVDAYVKIASRHEKKKVHARISGGAADVCYMSRPGLVVMDGLGATGGNMHRADEYAELASLQTRAASLAEFLEFSSRKLALSQKLISGQKSATKRQSSKSSGAKGRAPSAKRKS